MYKTCFHCDLPAIGLLTENDVDLTLCYQVLLYNVSKMYLHSCRDSAICLAELHRAPFKDQFAQCVRRGRTIRLLEKLADVVQADNYCYQGQCQSFESQCKRLWGSSSEMSIQQCYDLNRIGSVMGHCGLNMTTQTFKQCARR